MSLQKQKKPAKGKAHIHDRADARNRVVKANNPHHSSTNG